MRYKQTILALLFFLLLLSGGNEAFSQCSYVTTNEQGVKITSNIPCDFPVLMNTGFSSQDTLAYQNAAAQWNNLHPTLTAVSVLPEPVATGTYIEVPSSVFISFTIDRQAAMKLIPYYYKVKLQ